MENKTIDCAQKNINLYHKDTSLFAAATFMLKFFISLILILFIQQSFCSQPASQASTHMCPTDKEHQSSNMIRQWAFYILQRTGYQNPHEITIINAPSTPSKADPLTHQACAYAIRKTIHFNERYYVGNPVGVKLATVGHEAIHIQQNDDPKKFEDHQKHERYADQEALRLGGCEQCGLEIAEHYLNEQNKSNMHLFSNQLMPKNIKELQALTDDQLKAYMNIAHNVSEKHYTTHPCGFERAYYLYHLAQTAALKGHLCQFHKAPYDKELKRKIIIRSILQEAQQRKIAKGVKRSRDPEDDTSHTDEFPPEKK